MDKLLTEIDEFFKLDLSKTFDRYSFSRRKTDERRLSCSETIKPGQVVRSKNDRRVLPDRRRSWRRDSSGTINEISWES